MIAFAQKLSSPPLAWLRSARPALSLLALAALCPCSFGQLPTDLSLPSETLDSGYLVFQAANSITTSGSFLVQDPASVTLTSANFILLEPGFDAVATAGTNTFLAAINPSVTQWQPIPVPAPPTACTDCGLDQDEAASGINDITTEYVYSPNSSNQLYSFCTDADPSSPYYGYSVPCTVTVSTASYLYTNGHIHSNPLPPVSCISPSSNPLPPASCISPISGDTSTYEDYAIPVTLETTQVGQFETISTTETGCPEGIPCNEGNTDYAVGYTGLVYMGNSNIFAQIGATAIHGGSNSWNHWMTVNSATQFQNAATAYINGNNPGQKICINDMALPLGGKFDLNANWQSPHITHDFGTAADVAVKSVACSAISSSYLVNSGLFKNQCFIFGPATEVLLECTDAATGKTRQPCTQCLSTDKSCHVHCRWPN